MWIHRGFGSVPQKSWGDCRAACKRLTLPTELSRENYIWNRPYQYMRMATVGIRMTALSWHLWVNALCSLINSGLFLNWYDLANASISMFVFNILLQEAIEPLQKEPWTWLLCLQSTEAISKQQCSDLRVTIGSGVHYQKSYYYYKANKYWQRPSSRPVATWFKLSVA